MIVGDIVDPYFAEIARGVEEVGADLGYLTMVCSAEVGTEAELGHLRQLRDYHAAGHRLRRQRPRAATRPRPTLADAVADARDRGSVIVALAQRDFDAPSDRLRQRGAPRTTSRRTCAGLGHERDHVRRGSARPAHERAAAARASSARAAPTSVAGGFSYEDGLRAAETLLARERLPDAVVAANDEAAIGVLMRLRDARRGRARARSRSRASTTRAPRTSSG